MNKTTKFRVYLAGPISGCNDGQLRGWRDEIIKEYEQYFEFEDPASESNLRERNASSWEIVNADLEAIKGSDGMIVNMWRESIGTSIGLVHAQSSGIPIVMADPNRIESRMAGFYADAITDLPQKAARALFNILRGRKNWKVLKSKQRPREDFDRQKLVNALRGACRDAELDDVAVPRLALPGIMEQLEKSKRKVLDTFTSTDINNAVIAALEELENDPAHESQVRGLSSKWREERIRPNPVVPDERPSYHPREASKRDFLPSGKSHGTIWGKQVPNVGAIQSPQARRIFELIWQIPGITGIKLTAFGHKEQRNSPGAWLNQSKTANILEGKLFDKGDKGTVQNFQVHVQFDQKKSEILRGIENILRENELWHD